MNTHQMVSLDLDNSFRLANSYDPILPFSPFPYETLTLSL